MSVAALKAQRSPSALRVQQTSVPKPGRRYPASRTRAVAVAAQRKHIEPFSGCNCYYLLTKSKENYHDGRDLVLRTLDQIKEIGFTVIRTWAFQDDPDPGKGGALQYKDPCDGQIKYNDEMFNGLTWLMDECHNRELQLMLCLTNGNPRDYGGMRQYVRWSRGIPYSGQDVSNGEFFNDSNAQQLYKNYLEFMINKFKGHSAVHSWDLANEPRCQGDISCDKINKWIADTASFVKNLDPTHPLTVGVEGFFGASTPELSKGDKYNPYWGETDKKDHWAIEGCDFVGNFKSPNIDFASIHMYPSNWNIAGTPDNNRTRWSLNWIKDHIDVCKDPTYGLNNIPLVLQEFNVPAYDHSRKDLFKLVSDLLLNQVAARDVFKGSMVWCMADPSQATYDTEQYYMYARSVSGNNNNINPKNNSQVEVLEDLSRRIKSSRR